MTEAGVRTGLAFLFVAFDRELTEDAVAVFLECCRGEFASDAEFLARCKAVAKSARAGDRLTPSLLLAGRVESDRDREALARARAGEVFELINSRQGLRLYGRYSAETGRHYDAGIIGYKLGYFAYAAFRAAGGDVVFQATDPRTISFTRSAFVDAYRAAELAASRGQAPDRPEISAGAGVAALPGARPALGSGEAGAGAGVAVDNMREHDARMKAGRMTGDLRAR